MRIKSYLRLWHYGLSSFPGKDTKLYTLRNIESLQSGIILENYKVKLCNKKIERLWSFSTQKFRFLHFLTTPHYVSAQNEIIYFFDYWFLIQNLSNFVSLPKSKMIWIFLKNFIEEFLLRNAFFDIDIFWQLQFLKPFIFWNIGQFLMTRQYISSQNIIIFFWSINSFFRKPI